MKELLGTPETCTRDGFLLVRPQIRNVLRCVRSPVYNSSGRLIGLIVDVIGRIDDPRVVVKLKARELGEILYTRREPLYYLVQHKGHRKQKRK